MVSVGDMPSSSESNIPDPPPSRSSAINSLADMHSKTTNIPVSKHRSYHSLVAVKESLNAKSKISGLEKWKPPKEEKFDTEELQNDKRMLDRELRSSQASLDQLEAEFQEKRRMYRILEKQASDARFRLRHLESRFESKGNNITSRIQHEESTAELSLKEMQNRLEDEFNKQQFQLRSEIMDSANFEDTEAINEIEGLSKKKAELESRLEEVSNERDEAIRKEIESNKSELAALRSENEKKQAHLAELEAELEALTKQTEEKEAELESIRKEIKAFKESSTSAEASTEHLEETLHQKRAELASLDKDAVSWIENIRKEREQYESARAKYENYLSVHRTLEDAIMSFDPLPRSYVRVPAGLNVSIDEERILTVADRSYRFSKIFHRDDDSFLIQWEPFVQRALTQHNVTITFVGSEQQDIQSRLLDGFAYLQRGQDKLKAKGWTFTLSIQCTSIEGETTRDGFDSSNECKLVYERGKLIETTGKRIQLSCASDVKNAVQKLQQQPGSSVVFLFSIQAVNEKAKKAFVNHFSIVDLTQKDIASQAQTINLKSTQAETQFFSHVQTHTRSSYVCEFDNTAPDTLILLSSIARS
ncbi:uncharacterized protein CXQ87_003404 [Candidozyma duobushaemuli]|nr:uncharacterized protein CXQ87_003404 [[Candida] duobushaemulonis]PVH15561.1 hypothetical protein CXQ87_003404 [[Candida] duobushaemulonis]